MEEWEDEEEEYEDKEVGAKPKRGADAEAEEDAEEDEDADEEAEEDAEEDEDDLLSLRWSFEASSIFFRFWHSLSSSVTLASISVVSSMWCKNSNDK